MRYSAALELAVFFPRDTGLPDRGACITLEDVARFIRNGWYYGSKYRIASLIFRRNMEQAEAYGRGNRSARRVAMIQSPEPAPLTDADIENIYRSRCQGVLRMKDAGIGVHLDEQQAVPNKN